MKVSIKHERGVCEDTGDILTDENPWVLGHIPLKTRLRVTTGLGLGLGLGSVL